MHGARRALAVTSPATSSLVKTGGCAAVQPRAPAQQVKANRGEPGRGEGREGAMRSGKARSGGRRMGREAGEGGRGMGGHHRVRQGEESGGGVVGGRRERRRHRSGVARHSGTKESHGRCSRGRPWSTRIAAHEAWPEAADLVEQRGSTWRLDEADAASRWQLTSSKDDGGAVAARLPVDGNGGALARAGRRQHDDGARIEQGDARSASMEWAAPDTEAAAQRARTGDPAWLRTERAQNNVLSGPSFSRTHGDKGRRFARPIRAGHVAA
jgi:hypothetical protein